jgi:hypothetical protein
LSHPFIGPAAAGPSFHATPTHQTTKVRWKIAALEVDVNDVCVMPATPHLKTDLGKPNVESHVLGHGNQAGPPLDHIVCAAAAHDGLLDVMEQPGEIGLGCDHELFMELEGSKTILVDDPDRAAPSSRAAGQLREKRTLSRSDQEHETSSQCECLQGFFRRPAQTPADNTRISD